MGEELTGRRRREKGRLRALWFCVKWLGDSWTV